MTETKNVATVDLERLSDQEINAQDLYFDSIKYSHPYTPEEETIMFTQYQMGLNFLKEFTQSPSFQQDPMLFLPFIQSTIDTLGEIQTNIAFSNQKLVISIVTDIRAKNPLFDRIREGNVGLFKAINTFDLSKGNKFSTYATKVIMRHMWKDPDSKDEIISIPTYKKPQIGQLNRYQEKFEIVHGRLPTKPEIMSNFSWSSDTYEQVIQAASINSKILSLDAPVKKNDGSDNDYLLSETIIDEDSKVAFDTSFNNQEPDLDQEALIYALKTIRQSDTAISIDSIAMYLEYFAYPETTLAKLAENYSLTQEVAVTQLQQIQTKLHSLLSIPEVDFMQYDSARMKKGENLTIYQSGKQNVAELVIQDAKKFITTNADQKIEIYKAYQAAYATLEDVGSRYGITKERTRQIVEEVQKTIDVRDSLSENILNISSIIQQHGLNTKNAIVVGSGILQALQIRKSHDVDIVVTKRKYNELQKTQLFAIRSISDRPILVDKHTEIGTDWQAGDTCYSFSDLMDNSMVIDGVRYVSLDFIHQVKKRWGRRKDIIDAFIIDLYKQIQK